MATTNPLYSLNDKIMDHSYWTTAEQRARTRPKNDNKKPSFNQWKARRRDREWERERERGRDRTSQSKLSWSLTIMSHTLPLPPPYTFLFSKLCFLSFLLWPAAVEVSVQHFSFLSTVSFFLLFLLSCAASIRALNPSGVIHPVTPQPVRVELTARSQRWIM